MQFFPLTERIHSSSILRRGVEYEISVKVRSGRAGGWMAGSLVEADIAVVVTGGTEFSAIDRRPPSASTPLPA